MTILVAVKTPDGPALYGDSLTSTELPYRTDLDRKIFAGRGCLYGFAGGAGACERLAMAFHEAFGESLGDPPERCDVVRVLLNVEHAQDAEFLFVDRNDLYYGCGDGTLTAVRGPWATIGSGGAFVSGYLQSKLDLGHDATTDAEVRQALTACFAAYPDACGGRIDYLTLE